MSKPLTVLTVKQTAETLSISSERVRQLIYRGKLKATKTGRDWLVDPKSVQKRLQENDDHTLGYA